MIRNDVRNIAIIAHVDHGKTTMVDQLLKQNGVFRANEAVAERVMDNNDLERERGITILAKNTAVHYKGTKINIIDTPGHADFGGEVERILSMVDGVVLLVDAVEGCMPQTRYVLKKALGLNKKPIVVVNKVDRGCDYDKIANQVIDLFFELGANDDQLDFKTVYASGKMGWATLTPGETGKDMQPLLDTIISEIPAPQGDESDGLQAIICNIDYDEYVGRIGIGKIVRGTLRGGQLAAICHADGSVTHEKIVKMYQFEGLKRVESDRASVGDIIAISGIEKLNIGETVCDVDMPEPLPFVAIDEPTLSMMFIVNNSPFAGKEGKAVTSAKIWERLQREALRNVSIRIEKNPDDTFIVKGRGEFQMAIIAEEMRREGFEFCVGRPHIIFKTDENGRKTEPVEYLLIDCPEESSGIVMEKLGKRKAIMSDITYTAGGRVKIRFEIPSRGLIGYRDEFLTDTKGFGIMNTYMKGYEPYKGDFPDRYSGSLICDRSGVAVAYGIWELEDRGRMFIVPGDDVYEGEVVGERNREGDLMLNPTRTKKLTNLRASGKDEAVALTPVVKPSLESAIQFIKDDELVEVTPLSIRMCKKILDTQKRKIFEQRGEIPEYLK